MKFDSTCTSNNKKPRTIKKWLPTTCKCKETKAEEHCMKDLVFLPHDNQGRITKLIANRSRIKTQPFEQVLFYAGEIGKSTLNQNTTCLSSAAASEFSKRLHANSQLVNSTATSILCSSSTSSSSSYEYPDFAPTNCQTGCCSTQQHYLSVVSTPPHTINNLNHSLREVPSPTCPSKSGIDRKIVRTSISIHELLN